MGKCGTCPEISQPSRPRSTQRPAATKYCIQKVNAVTAGTSYSFQAWVNIPATSDAFSMEVQVRWRDGSNVELRTDLVKAYTGPTGGWDLATANLVAPPGTAMAVVRMKVKNLNATIYVDEVSLTATSVVSGRNELHRFAAWKRIETPPQKAQVREAEGALD